MRTATKRAQEFLERFYQEPIIDASDDAVLFGIQNLFELQSQKKYVVIEDILNNADVARIAPVLLVTLVRATVHARKHLCCFAWQRLFTKCKAEFIRRGISEDQDIWTGLPPKWNED